MSIIDDIAVRFLSMDTRSVEEVDQASARTLARIVETQREIAERINDREVIDAAIAEAPRKADLEYRINRHVEMDLMLNPLTAEEIAELEAQFDAELEAMREESEQKVFVEAYNRKFRNAA